MNWQQAVKLMKEGKKVKRPTFHKDNYLYFDKHILMSGITKQRAYLVEAHFEANDWEEYTDKKTLSDKGVTLKQISDTILGGLEQIGIQIILSDEQKRMIKDDDDRAYNEQDIKEALNSFLLWCEKVYGFREWVSNKEKKIECINITNKAKEIFGERLLK